MKKKKITKNIAVILSLSVITGSMPLSQITSASAAGKTALSASKMTLAVGGEKVLKLKNNKKKTIWRITAGKKYIRLKNKAKNSVKIAGIKAGTAKVQVKAGKAKYACKLIVKAKANPNASEQVTLAPQLIVPVPNAPMVSVNPPVTEQPATQAPQRTEGMATEAPIESMQPADEIPTKIPLTSEKPAVTKIPLVPETEKPAVTKIPLSSETELPAVTKTPQVSESETPSATQTPSETEKPEVTPSATTEPEKVQYEKHLGEKVDDLWNLGEEEKSYYDTEGAETQLTDINSQNTDVNDVTIANSGKVWISCGDHLIKNLGDDFNCYFQKKNVKYAIAYREESFFSGMGADAAGYYVVRAASKEDDGYTHYRDFYVMKQIHEFVAFDGTLNGIHVESADVKGDGLNSFTDIYGTTYKIFETGMEYRMYAPFDILDAGDDIDIMSYTGQGIDKKTITYEKNVAIVEKNADDVAALKQMVKMLQEDGAEVNENVNDRKQYEWKSGHLVSIKWNNKGIKGNLDFGLFDGLRNLNISKNSLSGVDISKNKELITLKCNEANLKKLDVTQNKNLETLFCNMNELGELDVSGNTELNYLQCSLNELQKMDFEYNKKLSTLICSDNRISELNVMGNVDLEYLECENNQLTNLDVSKDTNLDYLDCGRNLLENINLENNKELRTLYCSKNKIKSLNVAECKELNYLDCSYNNLSELNVSVNIKLDNLHCSTTNIKLLIV